MQEEKAAMDPESSTSCRAGIAVSISRRSCWAVSVLILLLRPAAAIRVRELAERRGGGLSSRSVEEVERRWQDLPEAALAVGCQRKSGKVDIVAESIRLDGVARWLPEGGGSVSETREQGSSARRRLFASLAPGSCPDTGISVLAFRRCMKDHSNDSKRARDTRLMIISAQAGVDLISMPAVNILLNGGILSHPA